MLLEMLHGNGQAREHGTGARGTRGCSRLSAWSMHMYIGKHGRQHARRCRCAGCRRKVRRRMVQLPLAGWRLAGAHTGRKRKERRRRTYYCTYLIYGLLWLGPMPMWHSFMCVCGSWSMSQCCIEMPHSRVIAPTFVLPSLISCAQQQVATCSTSNKRERAQRA